MSISTRRSMRGTQALAMVGVATFTAFAMATPAHAAGDLVITRVDIVQQPAGEVAVTWEVTGSDTELTGYEVTRAESGPPVSVATTAPAVLAASDPLTGVAIGGHLFTYTVAAKAGPRTITSLSASTSTIFQDVPSAPVDINIVTLGAVVTLHWQPPQVNATLLDHYQVQRRIDGGAWNLDPASPIAPSPAPMLVETVAGLATGAHEVEYIITSVAAAGSGGEIQFLASIFVDVPDWPASVTARMGFDGTSGIVTWTPPAQNPGLVTGYRIVRTVASVEETLATVAGGIHQYADTGLGPVAGGASVIYTVTALAGAHDGGGAPGFLTVDHTALAFPNAPTVTARQRTLDVTWTPPPTAGIPVTSYNLRYRPVGGLTWLAVAEGLVNSVTRQATITGLADSTAYEVQVSAIDPAGGGTSAWSPSGHATTPTSGSGGGPTTPASSGGPTTPASGGGGGGSEVPRLPDTGVHSGPVALTGIGVIMAGVVLRLLVRLRRRKAHIA